MDKHADLVGPVGDDHFQLQRVAIGHQPGAVAGLDPAEQDTFAVGRVLKEALACWVADGVGAFKLLVLGRHAYSTVYSPGYYVNTTSYFVESSLFNTESESLLWTGQTETTDPASVKKESGFFAEVVVTQMLTDGAILPISGDAE